MKTTTYLLLLALLMAGCGESRQIEPEKIPELVEGIVSIPLRRGSAIIREIKIDSCEYLYDFNSTLNVPTTLSHKGNCKNPIHKSNL